MSDLTPFDLSGPLPRGTAVLEASAGTGKTFTIAGLVARWVAETELRLHQLLVVTFTRAATAELRDRVRRRLVDCADHLEAILAGDQPATLDPVLTVLADGTTAQLQERHERLVRAMSDVDIATISTIHGFCQHVLDGIGIASDLDPAAELVGDVDDLIEEAVDDLTVRTWLDAGETPRVKRDELIGLARTVVGNPKTLLAPADTDDEAAQLRLALAEELRDDVARRARRRRLLSYDDLLTQLDDTLRHEIRGGAAREALRQRYRVVLIDEFQDTDPVQWSIVKETFRDAASEDNGRALVLIGDPKQAIYAFRGADVFAYLDASRQAEARHTLGTSWRSDARLLTAFDTLFDGATFGDVDIPFRRVDHAPGHDQVRLDGATSEAALRLRVVPELSSTIGGGGKVAAPKVRELIADDLAADIVRTLEAGPELVGRDTDGNETDRRALAPGDIAVLVRSNYQGVMVQEALDRVGVPAVISGVSSVFATPAATDVRRLLEALERPASTSRVRALALTSWVGWTADEVAVATESQWDQLHEDVHHWARLLRDHGVATMHRTVLLQRAVRARLLGREGGERRLADLEHIAELLHGAATGEHLGITGLVAWLAERITEAHREQNDDRLRRLETDDDAVQITTIHGSKGLEFPVVYCPFLWSSDTDLRDGQPPVFHDDDRQRWIDVGGETHGQYSHHVELDAKEARGEELRLLYVALTRAKHQVVAWYSPAGKGEWSGLGRLLMNRDPDGRARADERVAVEDLHDAIIEKACRDLASRSDRCIGVEIVADRPELHSWARGDVDEIALARATFERTLDESWRRTSYSALTRMDHHDPRVGSETAEAVKDDEALADPIEAYVDQVDDDADGLRDVTLPLAEMPGGTEVGTFVHHVMEHTDFTVDDLEAEIDRVVGHELDRSGLEQLLDREVLVRGVAAAITTPMGPRVGGLALRDVTRADRRDEVEFELPLDISKDGATSATVGDIAELMRSHLDASDPLADYPDHIPDELLGRDLRGFLGGSIDLVLRRRGAADDGRDVFHVLDHKTNRLGTYGEPLTAWDYRQSALADGMIHGHYPIQALVYAVALHRTLRWRLPDYDPEVNLGSAIYLFLRGMAGPDTPAPDGHPCGVFAWDLPASLVVATSDLLHGKVLV